MAKSRYEYCEVADIRCCVEEQLQNLPARKSGDEPAAEFWSSVERAGLLIDALGLYDEIASERSELRRTRRETKKEFDERIKREGRQAEAERVRAELLASGHTQRQAQVKLVERFQPRDGTKTKAWDTPDPWEAGRLFKKKADQDEALKLARREQDDEDEEEELTEAEKRLFWAERRRDERQALADARRRAWVLRMEQEKLPRSAKHASRPKPSANGRQMQTVVYTGNNEDRVVI